MLFLKLLERNCQMTLLNVLFQFYNGSPLGRQSWSHQENKQCWSGLVHKLSSEFFVLCYLNILAKERARDYYAATFVFSWGFQGKRRVISAKPFWFVNRESCEKKLTEFLSCPKICFDVIQGLNQTFPLNLVCFIYPFFLIWLADVP